MNETLQLSTFIAILPEIILLFSAMMLLIAGVVRGEVSAPAVNSACITMLFLVALADAVCAARTP